MFGLGAARLVLGLASAPIAESGAALPGA